ncbi:hypothetical protein D3C73_1274150 [compost metagenome]
MPQQEAVHLPARDHRIVARKHLVHGHRVDGPGKRQADKHQHSHPDQLAALIAQEGLAIG